MTGESLKGSERLQIIQKNSTSENNLIELICSHFHTPALNTVFVFNFQVHQVEKNPVPQASSFSHTLG